jgi:hypothetical protein
LTARRKLPEVNNIRFGRSPAISPAQGGTHMQQLMTFMAVVGGLVFSVAVALVVEEFIFGKVFQLFFTPVPVRVRAGHRR